MAKGGAIRWTPGMLDEYQRRTAKPTPAPTVAPAKRSKYRSQKVEQDGIKFDSKKEARRWSELQMMQVEGQISGLKRQVPFVLAPAVKLEGEARTKPALRYVADATYMQDGQMVVEDTKSAPTRKTPIYRAKKHLMATVHNIHIKEV
jgi:hypothetical protein